MSPSLWLRAQLHVLHTVDSGNFSFTSPDPINQRKENFSVLVSSRILEADVPLLTGLYWVTLSLDPVAVSEWQNGPMAQA